MTTSRRTLLKAMGYAGVAPLMLPRLARAASANGKVNLAFVGAMGQAGYSFENLMEHNIVAVADVDASSLDKRREELRKNDTYPQDPKLYRDYRIMLYKEAKNIDAFVVATPDHHHAHAALRGMAMGKHCYCEKPLAHSVQEVRLMEKVAAEKNLVTQMGTQIHAGGNYRRVVEKVRSGAIGAVKEVHVWLYGATYRGARFPERPDPIPASLNWDLWLGPAEVRPYYDKLYHPFNWRGWWDFGGGGTTDMACHWVDLPHWALGLSQPHTVRTHANAADPIRATAAMMVEMEHAARDDRPPVKVTWHLGGTHIDRLNVFEKYGIPERKYGRGEAPPDTRDPYVGSKTCFIGTDGMLLSDYYSHYLLPEEKFVDFRDPEPTIPDSIGHHAEWIKAIREGTPTTCNFQYSGALTEAVLLGIVSHRAGNVEVGYDGETGRVTNSDKAQRWTGKTYRRGWEIDALV